MKITRMQPIITTDKPAEEKAFYTTYFEFKLVFELPDVHIGLKSGHNDGVELSFMAPNWIVTAWCEHKHDFRNFRLDRVFELQLTQHRFENEPGKTLDDFLPMFEQKLNPK